ncbi:uncharacterized protein [Anser cygnoides]|uniref:uncharacterized protein isoform X2 n=1 Tax=Anser cygnoides TaxID=8845 RepID=UPI0034D1D0B4
MLLLAALVATAAWSDGFAQEIPLQTPVSITKSQGSTRLLCHFKHVSEDFDNTIIHWYQQKENKAPEWMFYISTGTTKADKSFQGHKYAVERVSDQKICTLIIKSIVPDDTATYYCAYWEPHYGRNPAITSTNTCTCREVPTGPRRPQAPQELEPRRGAAIGCWVPEPLLSAPQVPDPSLPVAGDGRTLPGPVHGGRLDVVPRACCRCRCRCFWLPLPFAAVSLRWSCAKPPAAKTFRAQSGVQHCADRVPFLRVRLYECLHSLVPAETRGSPAAPSVRGDRGGCFLQPVLQ